MPRRISEIDSKQAQNYMNMAMQMYSDNQKLTADQEFKKWQMEKGVPYYSLDVSGNPVFGGMLPKGAMVRQSPESIVAIAKAKNELPTADMKNQLTSTKQAKALVTELLKQSEGLKGSWAGMAEIAKGAINRGEGKSADYRLYLSNMPSAATAVYRSVTGDTRLSDADAQARAYPLLWHPSEHTDTRTKKNEFISNMITAREILLKANKFTTDDNGEKITPLEEVTKIADKIALAKKKGYSDDEIAKFLGSR